MFSLASRTAEKIKRDKRVRERERKSGEAVRADKLKMVSPCRTTKARKTYVKISNCSEAGMFIFGGILSVQAF